MKGRTKWHTQPGVVAIKLCRSDPISESTLQWCANSAESNLAIPVRFGQCNQPQCVANDNAPGPGMSPSMKDGIFFDAIIESLHKTLLRLLVIGCQREGKQVVTQCVFFEQPAKVFSCRIRALCLFR